MSFADQYLLRRDVTFLNHGSFGACPRPVFDTYQMWQRELEADPVDFFVRHRHPALAVARAQLAAFVGTHADHLVFVPNTTFGINVIARSLDLQAGDEVLSSNHEYGAVNRTWRFNGDTRGATLVYQPISLPLPSADEIVEQLWAGVTPRTRVISISHITSATALIFPVAQICARAREAGILTVIDGAHAPGQIQLDLDAIGADFYVGNCHKWLSAPKGAAFLYAAPARQELLRPFVISWGWQSENPSHSLFIDHFEQQGTTDVSAYLSVPAAIDFQREHDWPAVQASCHALLQQVQERIGTLTSLPSLSDDSAWVQMCSIPLPDATDHSLGQLLWDEYRIEVPITRWEGHTCIRVSIQAYNTQQDVDTLIGALEHLLPR